MINLKELMATSLCDFDTALGLAVEESKTTLDTLYLPASSYDYVIKKLHHISSPIFHLVGDGMYASRIWLDGPEAGIVVDQRAPNYERGNSCQIYSIGITTSQWLAHGRSPLKIIGQGTENWMQGSVGLQGVQFGNPDKRSVYQGSAPKYYPNFWIELSGVVGLTLQHCNFAGARKGSAVDFTNYAPYAAVFISSSSGEVTELDNTSHPARSTKLLIQNNNFAPGIHYGILVDRSAWVEGLSIVNNRMTDVWEGITFVSDGHTPGTGTSLDIRDNNINFRHRAISVGAGVADIRGNYTLSHANGVFMGDTCHIQLGELDNPVGPTLTHVEHNNMGFSNPANVPAYGVLVGDGCFRCTIGPNDIQKVQHHPVLVSQKARETYKPMLVPFEEIHRGY